MDIVQPFGTYAPQGLVRWAVDTTRRFPDGWLARRGTILIRRLVASRLRGAPVDIEALGARMRVLPYNNVCEKRMLFAPQTFDRQELAILADRIHDRFTFLDIGANIGAYSLFVAARAGPAARIVAVEPQPDIYERLVANARLNGFGNIRAVPCAVADRTGEVTLFIDPKNSGESSVKIVGTGSNDPIRVPSTTLAELVRNEGIDRIDAIKLDVEGAEDIVLEPFLAGAADAQLPSLLVIENGADRWQSDLPAQLAARGYRRIAQTRLNIVFERDGG